MVVVIRIRRLTLALIAAGSLALLVADGAGADVQSANWSGYAVHRSGVSFSRVSAAWTEPFVMCLPGRTTYAAFWVGLGGYHRHIHALEQVGTEIDCSAWGQERAAVWFELLPAPTRRVRLRVSPGDTIAAAVSTRGHLVTVALADFTTGRGFRKTVRAARVDVSSAEWIVEAPTACIGNRRCRILPLANFGSAEFSNALARSASGHTGTIEDPLWRATRIMLRPGGRTFTGGHGGAAATASPLQLGGSVFQVTFSRFARAAAAVSVFH
jgi:hypothetical protein